jgi:hypothetical protein
VDEEEELGEEVEEEEEEGKEEDKEAALGFEEGGEGVGRRRARDAGYELSFVTRWQQSRAALQELKKAIPFLGVDARDADCRRGQVLFALSAPCSTWAPRLGSRLSGLAALRGERRPRRGVLWLRGRLGWAGGSGRAVEGWSEGARTATVAAASYGIGFDGHSSRTAR